jgi:hypothetical protein
MQTNRFWIHSICFLLVLTACNRQQSANEEAFERISMYSMASIAFIDKQIENALHIQQSRLDDPSSSYKARLWQPKLMLIQNECDQMVAQLKAFHKTANVRGEMLNDQINKFKESLLEIRIDQ